MVVQTSLGGKTMRILLLAVIIVTLSACSFSSNDASQEMDTPPINYVDENELLQFDEEDVQSLEQDDEEEIDEEEGIVQGLQERELYLIDANGLVVPQTIQVPQTEGVLKQSLEYLVDGGPISELLPNGFRAVLPPGTEVDVHLQGDEGLAIVDFSNEFKEYNPSDEVRILQSITWTLTQFDNVDAVQIRINGYEQETMPLNGTPIDKALSRENGINIEADFVANVVDTKGITLYFLAQSNEQTYYVPVTRRVSTKEEPLTAAVNELLKGPSYHSHLLSDFRQDVMLENEPTYENGVVTLNFNESILSQLESTAISTDVVNMLALTLTEQEGVERVAIEVNGETVLTEEGVQAEPVMRPSFVNPMPS